MTWSAFYVKHLSDPIRETDMNVVMCDIAAVAVASCESIFLFSIKAIGNNFDSFHTHLRDGTPCMGTMGLSWALS